MSVKKCSKCSQSFECTNEKPGCWCENVYIDMDTLNKLRIEYVNCLCPACLKTYSSSENINKK